MPVILGTAGHIDHGKTTLVKALTGIDCDRLAEEKKRGITIELGFAFLDLPDGQRLGVVDVPGHERFVKNMVAGASGVDFVALVIAADEGIMPQTREHLEICSLLGVKRGVVALTKADLVDEEWLAMVTDEVRVFLAPTFLAGAEVIPVSAHTGRGLDALKAELVRLAVETGPSRRFDLPRLPVDRAFTMKGHGTVVTGTLLAGSLDVGQDVTLYPGGRSTRIRSLQVHGQPAQRARAGQRTAANLQGLEVEDVERGDTLAPPGSLFPSTSWTVVATCLASSPRGLRHRGQLHLHHGTREVMARLYFFDRDRLESGQTALCQARFETPLAGVFGDRMVMRAFSPLRTVAGATLVCPGALKLKKTSPELAVLAALPEAAPEDLALAHLRLAGREGASFTRLVAFTGLGSRDLATTLQDLSARGKASQFDRENRMWISGEVLDELSERILSRVDAFHKANPARQGLSRGELTSGLPLTLAPKLMHFLLEKLLKSGRVVQEQELLRASSHSASLGLDLARARDAVLAAYEAGGLTPPNLKDVIEPLGLTAKQAQPVFKLLQDEGRIARTKDDLFFAVSALERLRELVLGYFADRQELGPQDFRELTGLTRKYAIPLLEYLDKIRLTVRVGDKRLLRARS
ncbi:selenocysteine-specific translation elongation factor [Fundidesulfovibrio butyratiphilus]